MVDFLHHPTEAAVKDEYGDYLLLLSTVLQCYTLLILKNESILPQHIAATNANFNSQELRLFA